MKSKIFEKKHIGRFAIAYKKSDFNKTVVIQLVYLLRQESKKKRKNFIANYCIEIKSLNGLIKYRIQGVKNEGKTIIFLYGSNLYIVDLNKSLFD